MSFVVRLRSSDSGNGETTQTAEYVNDSQIAILAPNNNEEKHSYSFKKVLNDVASQQDVFEEMLREPLRNFLTKGEDAAVLTCGPSNGGSSYTMFGDRNISSVDGLIGRALHDIFEKVGEENLVSFKKLRKIFGSSLVEGKTKFPESKYNDPSASYGISMSLFEIHDDKVKDLFANLELSQRLSSNFSRDSKDGKLRPIGLSQQFLSSFDHSIQVLKSGLEGRNRKVHNVDCIIYVNVFELQKYNRLRCNRFTFADLAGYRRELRSKKRDSVADTLVSEVPKLLNKVDSDTSLNLKGSRIGRSIFSDAAKFNKHNVICVLSVNKFGEPANTKAFFDMLWPIKKVRSNTFSSLSMKELVDDLSSLKLEIIELKNKNSLLESTNKELNATLATIEHETRIEVSNHFEKMLDELSQQSMSSKLEDQELNQMATDEKLAKLSSHYNSKIENVRNESAALKIKLENLRYQNSRMDEVFHSRLSEAKDEERAEYEKRLKQELDKYSLEKEQLSTDNAMMHQKVHLLESQLKTAKERAERKSDEAEILYKKIKSLRLEDDVKSLIEKKVKAHLTKDKSRSKASSAYSNSALIPALAAKRRSSALGPATSEQNFKIYEDQPKACNKRKFVRTKSILDSEQCDLDDILDNV